MFVVNISKGSCKCLCSILVKSPCLCSIFVKVPVNVCSLYWYKGS